MVLDDDEEFSEDKNGDDEGNNEADHEVIEDALLPQV